MPVSSSQLVIGIDASNIRGGGGVVHLMEMLRAASPATEGVSKVIVWGGRKTLSQLEDRSWMEKITPAALEAGFWTRTVWQMFSLTTAVRAMGCDVLYIPGGTYLGTFRPFVACSQNLLPFDKRERKRYGWSVTSLRLNALRFLQSVTFRRASGIIYLSDYSRRIVSGSCRLEDCEDIVIAHGTHRRFAHSPRKVRAIEQCSTALPLRLLYVSTIDMYKHQWHIAEAVTMLRAKGLPIVLDLVGPSYPPALKRLQTTLRRIDPTGVTVRYHGELAHDQLDSIYANAELFVFGSSCESFGQIVTEAMASGLPIACARQGSQEEILSDCGVYFNAEDPLDIASVLGGLIRSAPERRRLAEAAFKRSEKFTWEASAKRTLAFLSSAAEQVPEKSGMAG